MGHNSNVNHPAHYNNKEGIECFAYKKENYVG